MSFFGNSSKEKDNQSANDREASDLLNAFGQAEREMPSLRPGRFGAVAAQLAAKDGKAVSQGFRFRPVFAVGGSIALIAATVGISTWMKMTADYTPVSAQPATASAQRVLTANGLEPVALEKDTEQKKLSVWGNGISTAADPVFVSSEYSGGALVTANRVVVVPFAVTVKNTGSDINGKIVVTVDSSNNGNVTPRVYNYPITIEGNGKITRKIVYPNLSAQWQRNHYDVSLEIPGKSIGLLGNYVTSPSMDYRKHTVAIIDKRIGVLLPRRDVPVSTNANLVPQYYSLYVKPQNAPDKAMGYESIDTLILGKGAENLSSAQWEAIRDWVKDGGSLMLLGGQAMRGVEENPFVKELSPAQSLLHVTGKIGKSPRFHLQSDDAATRFAEGKLPDDLTIAATLKPDARPLEHLFFDSGTGTPRLPQTIAATRQYGAGSVTTLGFDPTTREVRSQMRALTALWNVMGSEGVFAANELRVMGVENPWIGYRYYQDSNSNERMMSYARDGYGRPISKSIAKDDPFRVELPPLQIVLYVFLGYFVLVVPVSFVVLKQTRRMHLAWATGPVLAITFAGGLAAFTMKLYQASLSQRTAGVIAMEEGESTGRFHGFTELYVPRAGQYTLTLPGMDRSVDFAGNNGELTPTQQKEVKGLTTMESQGEEVAPELSIPNLAFRRVFHSQTMALGKGIQTDLHLDADGALVGTIDNDTGLTLNNVVIASRNTKKEYVKHRTWSPKNNNWLTEYRVSTPQYQYEIPTIKPGRMTVKLKRNKVDPSVYNDQWENLPPLQRNALFWQRRDSYGSAILTAQTSGDAFGPQSLGKSVGGDGSVGLMVRLPALTSTKNESVTALEPQGMQTKGGGVR